MSNAQQTILAADLPAIGQPLAGGTFFARQWYGDSEYALVALGADAEIEGEWGKYGKSIETNHGDGEANTRAMAEAGGELAAKVLALDAFIPSALESHQMMFAKQQDYLTDLDESEWYWTSTQRSADLAFLVYFTDGNQLSGVKILELRVRPVRRVLIQ
ncbi:hypothetical protein [Pseudomonas citronellolis]|uniref:hypothetical protein n=1 Tax=Pseudomonas citronellolis TaxID=53408 RepID=UPI0023E41C8F|nr:hypothetical protein [Pseudomonas citronellolis]MDF3936685.1 hypothetical protein [Pseudomonas citronellolis]